MGDRPPGTVRCARRRIRTTSPWALVVWNAHHPRWGSPGHVVDGIGAYWPPGSQSSRGRSTRQGVGT